ncbi:3-oxoacid CoA-transferase subunit B [Novosphingobium sp.]|uniref:3-oxoacid CoA-transferase subunit B n=1 Tax=Novosphingobium sp. TaxID=1874826 RepID=UPI00262C2262|nr:3-oxoacid CoA-transferase subunit B [Novosphingobium sp.]
MNGWTVEQIASKAARDIPNGAHVNLGIGQPERVADFLPNGREIVLHSENGILGMGPKPVSGAEDGELINAGKKPVTLLDGGSFFHHADSFAMIRGRHIDICIMGAFEVSMAGDLANWSTGKDGIPAVGGAMDLAIGARSVRVITSHVTRKGQHKLLTALSLPATAAAIVDRIYTDLAVLDPKGDHFLVIETAPGIGSKLLAELTGAPIRFEGRG